MRSFTKKGCDNVDRKVISFESKFGKPEKFNSQFHMIKIYIAHHGKNRNGSIISKETFEKMIPSLYGVPVVGEWKGEDFGSHGGKIEISEDGIEFIETTKPYGYVDSSATVQWENVQEEDGTVKEYLTTTAFLWTGRYPEVLKVLNGENNQSMEINVFEGDFLEDEPEYFEILDGEFSAFCILGEDVEGCFPSAKLSQFNLDKEVFKAEFAQMVSELKASLLEGGEGMKDEKVENVDEKLDETESFEEEVLEEETLEDETFEEEEIVEDEDFEEETVDEEEDSDEIDVEEEFEEDTESEEEEVENFTKTFELSHDDIRSKLYVAIAPQEQADEDWFYIIDVYDNHFVYIAEFKQKYYKQGYIKTDVDIALNGDRVEVFSKFLTQEELDILNAMKANYKLLEKENEELKEFKATKEKEAFEKEQERIRDEKINHINEEYPNVSDDVRDVFISKVDEYETIEDIDADMCVYIVKNKVTFSKAKKDNEVTKTKINQEEKTLEVSPYGSLF